MVHWVLLATAAWAQATGSDRPTVPSAGLAAEGGPGALWVNPGNLAYDPDARFAVLLTQDLSEEGRTAFAGTWGMGGLSIGAYNVLQPEGRTDWSLDLATGLPLPKRIALGARLSWHLVADGTNFVAWDVGASWRPLPWFGVSAVAQNVAGPRPIAAARSGVGVAVRPFGDTAVLGLDYLRTFDPRDGDLPDGVPVELYRISARLRPVEGLYVRASLDSTLTAGAGLEIYFGGYGAGAHGLRTEDGRYGLVASIGTDEPGESLVRSPRRVPQIDLRRLPPEQPRPRLIGRATPGWLDVLELLRRLEADRSVRGATITLGSSDASWARWQELRGRIDALEASGKRIVVYLHGTAPAGAYYAASAASRVFLHPAGELDLTGPSSEMLYVGGTLDWLGVEAQVARRSEYKTAAEPLTDLEPSAAQIEQWEALIGDLHDQLVEGVAAGRGVPPDEARRWVEAGPWTAQQALDMGLVDALGYADELERPLFDLYGFEPAMPRLLDTPQPHSAWEAPSQIAVIRVSDLIVGGESSDGGPLQPAVTGSETVRALLEKAAEDPEVRAVILRVDSAGGSAFASDEIWHAVRKVREEAGKPVVASLGGVAASGGYYVASAADRIYAEPSTITGSIGVITYKASAGDLLARFGATVTEVSQSRHADLSSPLSPWDAGDQEKVQEQVDAYYDTFLERVAEGRDTTPEAIDAVAGGRVWSARRALEHGLIDGLGGFEQAVGEARSLAGLPPRRKVVLVSYTATGLEIESLAPTLVHAAGPFARIPWSARRASPEPLVPDALTRAWAPLGAWARLADEGVLLFDPLAFEVQPR